MLNWLLYHRRLILLSICLLIVALIVLIAAWTLLSGHRTFVNAWFVQHGCIAGLPCGKDSL